MNYKITYGKSVHDSKEINAVVKTLKTSTAMGNNVSKLKNKNQN